MPLNIETIDHLIVALATDPTTTFFTTGTGLILSHKAVNDNLELVMAAIKSPDADLSLWRVVELDTNWNSELFCSHYGHKITSVYDIEGELRLVADNDNDPLTADPAAAILNHASNLEVSVVKVRLGVQTSNNILLRHQVEQIESTVQMLRLVVEGLET